MGKHPYGEAPLRWSTLMVEHPYGGAPLWWILNNLNNPTKKVFTEKSLHGKKTHERASFICIPIGFCHHGICH